MVLTEHSGFVLSNLHQLVSMVTAHKDVVSVEILSQEGSDPTSGHVAR